MKRAQPERQFQRAVAEYLSCALPADAVFTAIPAGDGRVTRAPGYRAGMPDIMVMYYDVNGDGPKVICFELKAKLGRLSRAQIHTHNALRIAGASVYTVKTLSEVEGWLRLNGIPLRAKVAA